MGQLHEHRLIAGLISTFGAIALLLSALGLYGTQSFEVSQGTREIGVRMALGATSGSVLGLVLKRTLVVALSGIVAGLFASLALTGLIANYLFGVTPTDPFTFASPSSCCSPRRFWRAGFRRGVRPLWTRCAR